MTTPLPLTPEQQLLLDQWQQTDNAFRHATNAYWFAHDAQVKAPDSQRLKAFNAQRRALDTQVKAYKWLRRAYHACHTLGFDPDLYRTTTHSTPPSAGKQQ